MMKSPCRPCYKTACLWLFAFIAAVLLGISSAARTNHQIISDRQDLVAVADAASKEASAPAGPSPQPKWRSQFSVRFNETTRIFVTKHTQGSWSYDAVTQQEATYRANGNGDRYCGSIHPFTQTPCVHIVTGGQRYLVFPDLGECCMCCTAAQGCGILATSWLQDASFEGTVQMQGVPAFKWRKDGLQPNYWYTTADDAQIPLQLDQLPNDLTTFVPESFLEGPPPPGAFALPDGCKPRCPLTSVCTIAAADFLNPATSASTTNSATSTTTTTGRDTAAQGAAEAVAAATAAA